MPIILQSSEDNSIAQMTDLEKDLVHKLRAMLKDLPEEQYRSLNTLVEKQRGTRWSDELLLIYIQTAIMDINSEPPLTAYTITGVPVSWHGCVLMGAFILALLGEAVVQSGEAFSYSDNGISLTIDLASKYQSLASGFLSAYQQQKSNLKKTIRPFASGITVGAGASAVHIRSYSPRMWVYR